MKMVEANGSRHDPVSCLNAMKLASRCWASFSSEPSNGTDLFRRENWDKIKALAPLMECSNPGGAFSAALKQMWDESDQDEWNDRARDVKDVRM